MLFDTVAEAMAYVAKLQEAGASFRIRLVVPRPRLKQRMRTEVIVLETVH